MVFLTEGDVGIDDERKFFHAWGSGEGLIQFRWDQALAILPTVRLGLVDALASNWLELWYQPKIDLRTKAIVGVEGLIRCRHPVHGVLSPASFLADADEESLATAR